MYACVCVYVCVSGGSYLDSTTALNANDLTQQLRRRRGRRFMHANGQPCTKFTSFPLQRDRQTDEREREQRCRLRQVVNVRRDANLSAQSVFSRFLVVALQVQLLSPYLYALFPNKKGMLLKSI